MFFPNHLFAALTVKLSILNENVSIPVKFGIRLIPPVEMFRCSRRFRRLENDGTTTTSVIRL